MSTQLIECSLQPKERSAAAWELAHDSKVISTKGNKYRKPLPLPVLLHNTVRMSVSSQLSNSIGKYRVFSITGKQNGSKP